MTMMLHQAANALRWKNPATSSRTRRAFFSASDSGIGGRRLSSAVGKAVGTNSVNNVAAASCNANNLVRMTSTMVNSNFVDGGLVTEAIGRTPPGNPSTMAFLGARAKSTAAAFHDQDVGHNGGYETLSATDVTDASNGAGNVASRSHQEAWMVNLGRGDDEWLRQPRNVEWYTGLDPSVCPGEYAAFDTRYDLQLL